MLEFKKQYECSCGRTHDAIVEEYIVEAGAIKRVPEFVKKYGRRKAFIVADVNTFKAAGEAVCKILKSAGFEYSRYVFKERYLEPDEKAAGSLMMHYDSSCDILVGVGSGVINDLCKILAAVAGVPYIIVATAPSMDGYASMTSSVLVDGVKWSLTNRCANVIIGDVDILKNAPKELISAGLGDMLAKYLSVCEWRLSNIITGEYYCEEIADMVRKALACCVDNAELLLKGDATAAGAVFEGLVLSGISMNYAGLTRSASGIEHSISHIWDMRSVEFGTGSSLHGTQCAVGTLYGVRIYEQILSMKPNREKAITYAEAFDFDAYSEKLRKFLGGSADAMIDREAVDGKYNLDNHKKRLDRIIKNWDLICSIIKEELPASKEIERILDLVDIPKSCAGIGIGDDDLTMVYAATKDIRDKYVQSRICWDLGIIDEIKI